MNSNRFNHITLNPLNNRVYHMQGKNNSSGSGNLWESSNKHVWKLNTQSLNYLIFLLAGRHIYHCYSLWVDNVTLSIVNAAPVINIKPLISCCKKEAIGWQHTHGNLHSIWSVCSAVLQLTSRVPAGINQTRLLRLLQFLLECLQCLSTSNNTENHHSLLPESLASW